jgi:hypothetical protein
VTRSEASALNAKELQRPESLEKVIPNLFGHSRNRKNVKNADKVFRKQTLESLIPGTLGPSSPTKLEKNHIGLLKWQEKGISQTTKLEAHMKRLWPYEQGKIFKKMGLPDVPDTIYVGGEKLDSEFLKRGFCSALTAKWIRMLVKTATYEDVLKNIKVRKDKLYAETAYKKAYIRQRRVDEEIESIIKKRKKKGQLFVDTNEHPGYKMLRGYGLHYKHEYKQRIKKRSLNDILEKDVLLWGNNDLWFDKRIGKGTSFLSIYVMHTTKKPDPLFSLKLAEESDETTGHAVGCCVPYNIKTIPSSLEKPNAITSKILFFDPNYGEYIVPRGKFVLELSKFWVNRYGVKIQAHTPGCHPIWRMFFVDKIVEKKKRSKVSYISKSKIKDFDVKKAEDIWDILLGEGGEKTDKKEKLKSQWKDLKFTRKRRKKV